MTSGKLSEQDPPNYGTLVERGVLGIKITSNYGFDIGSMSHKAYLVATVGTDTKIYNVNTSNGVATPVANHPNMVKGFSIGLGF